MAQWNPYFGVPNQPDSAYEEPNLRSQNYYGVQALPFNPVPLQPVNYNGYYVPNNIYSNFGTNLTGTVYNVQEIEAQQFANYSQNSSFAETANSKSNPNVQEEPKNGNTAINDSSGNSTLHATAVEFKPSTSSMSTKSQISTQTYYRKNQSQEESRGNKGAVRKYNKPLNDPKNVRNGSQSPVTDEFSTTRNSRSSNEVRYDNRRSYNKNNGQNYNNMSYNRDRNNRGYNKREDYAGNEIENNQRYNQQNYNKYEYNRSNKYENKDLENRRENDNKSNRYENNFNRNYRRQDFNRDNNEMQDESTSRTNNYRQNRDNREGSYNRYHREYPDRNNDRSSYSRDNYNKSNAKNSYRNNRYDNKGYENWRTGPTDQEKKTESRGRTENDTSKSRSFDKDWKPYRNDKRFEKIADDDISQRDRLTEQVNKGNLECLVCCERVRQVDKIWHCQKCFHIFHFRCIIKWGNTSKDENGWRCPACQHVCIDIPSSCYCYCGKVNDPPYNPTDTAHSCGNICGRIGIKPGCIHRCNLFCHPGPCPKCEHLVSKHCNCGATTQMVKCSADTLLVCNAICSKELECGVHKCTKICHGGDCEVCAEIIKQECYCGKFTKEIPCNKDQTDVTHYSCEQICDKTLNCGNHKCKEVCHIGDCPPCTRAPDQVKTCPCGKSKLEVVRTSCLDPIPCCGKICGKRYPKCGTASNPHVCKSQCHESECPNCPLTSFVRCRCGHMNCELTCAELVSRTDDARCEKKCTKKRSCGRHKCNQMCCIDIDHICPLPCNHMLTCGLHRCEQTCHKGRCQPCWRISFDELYCECNTAVIYPPVPCGTKRPPCNKPCSRQHACEHEPLHTCHSQPYCPPCSVLTSKVCYGGHEKRNTIPCHQKEFSCGLPCGKELPCGRHKCQMACHKGPCVKDGQNCSQSCTLIRENCGHPCGLPCHEAPCPESPCKESVKVTCQCGLRSSSRACVDMAGEYQRIATSLLASKMADMQLGHSIDIGDIVGTTTRKQTHKTLECNDECRLVERNRRLAIGLQIRNPDLSAKLTPRYSDFMRQWAKKDSSFCQLIHDKLTELVQLAKQSKQKSRSFSFPSMNREKRQFIHEYCEHFGCESAAYDQEPNRNVVATAARDKAWLPSCSLLELIQRESGQRKVPGPILNRPLGVSKTPDTVSLKISSKSTSTNVSSSTSFSSALQQQSKSPEDIDYFNFPSGSK